MVLVRNSYYSYRGSQYDGTRMDGISVCLLLTTTVVAIRLSTGTRSSTGQTVTKSPNLWVVCIAMTF